MKAAVSNRSQESFGPQVLLAFQSILELASALTNACKTSGNSAIDITERRPPAKRRPVLRLKLFISGIFAAIIDDNERINSETLLMPIITNEMKKDKTESEAFKKYNGSVPYVSACSDSSWAICCAMVWQLRELVYQELHGQDFQYWKRFVRDLASCDKPDHLTLLRGLVYLREIASQDSWPIKEQNTVLSRMHYLAQRFTDDGLADLAIIRTVDPLPVHPNCPIYARGMRAIERANPMLYSALVTYSATTSEETVRHIQIQSTPQSLVHTPRITPSSRSNSFHARYEVPEMFPKHFPGNDDDIP